MANSEDTVLLLVRQEMFQPPCRYFPPSYTVCLRKVPRPFAVRLSIIREPNADFIYDTCPATFREIKKNRKDVSNTKTYGIVHKYYIESYPK